MEKTTISVQELSAQMGISLPKHKTGICYSTEITCKGSIWQKDDTKCENF